MSAVWKCMSCGNDLPSPRRSEHAPPYEEAPTRRSTYYGHTRTTSAGCNGATHRALA